MKNKLKKIFNLYNLAILGCVIIIIISLIIIIEPDFSNIINRTNTSEQKTEEGISEEKAVKIAKKKFKELGEKNINDDELEVLKISRQGEEYYYISSKENTVEIKIIGGNITRVNSVKVE